MPHPVYVLIQAFSGYPATGDNSGLSGYRTIALRKGSEAGNRESPIRVTRTDIWGGTVTEARYEVVPVGWVESSLTERAQAPRQGHEGAPSAWLAFEAAVADALRDLRPGIEIIVLTWLDRADRQVLVTRPRDDPRNPPTGVFSTRSPDRPNPIGLHRVPVVAVDGLRIQVDGLEALDGTPVIDVKPVLDRTAER